MRRSYRASQILCITKVLETSCISITLGCLAYRESMTTRRPSPTPSEYSTGYKPGEAHWRSRMSRSPTLSDSRYEHRSPRYRGYPTVDVRQPLYTEFRNTLREHRRQEDEARDSLVKQIRDHREQQDDLLLRIFMESPRAFGMSSLPPALSNTNVADESNTVDCRSSTWRREPTAFYSVPPRETMEIDSVLGSQLNSTSQYFPVRQDSEESEDLRPTVETKKQQSADRDRARSRTARAAVVDSDDEKSLGDSKSTAALREASPQDEPRLLGRTGKRKSELKRGSMAPPPPKRKAAVYAAKRNQETLKFFRQTQRQQSLAIEEGRASAITTECTCSQLTCKTCGPLARINQDSFEEKWK